MTGILSGIRVIDAGSFLAGPCAATIMSDFGADVIKVEPLTGDRHRSISGGHPIDFAWQLTGRNKRSLALDLTTQEGYRLLVDLVTDADVLLVNFSTGQLERYGLTYETLKTHNPRLVFAQICAYGAQGDQAERRAFDLTAWFARTGILDMMHEKDVPPAPPAGGVGDHATAMTLFAGIMTALYKRDRTGVGSMVTTSLAATGAWANGLHLQAVMAGVDIAARRDREGWSNPLQNVYTCRDGRFIMLAVQNIRRDWPTLARVLGHPEWLDDERFSSVKPLFRNRKAAKAAIADAFLELDSGEAGRRLLDAGIVFSLVARNAEVVSDEQLLANGLIVPTASTEPGYDRTLATPFQLSDEAQQTPRRAPRIGEHSRQILMDAGVDDAEIDALIERGVIGSPDGSPADGP